MKDKKRTTNSKLVNEMINAFVDSDSIKSDPNGSYTGKGAEPFSVPIQDQDDL